MDMTETMEAVLAHVGVKGMRWGVRKDQLGIADLQRFNTTGLVKTYPLSDKAAKNPEGPAVRKAAEATAAVAYRLTDLKTGPFSNGGSVRNFNMSWRASGNSAKDSKRDDYDTKLAKLLTDEANKYTKRGTQARVSVIRDAEGKETMVLSMGSKLATDSYHNGLKKVNAVVHSEDEVSVITFDLVRDTDGFVINVRPKGGSLAMTDLTDVILAHVGVKGMRWGVRKRRPAVVKGPSKPEPVKLRLEPGKPVGAAGGRAHPPSSDAKSAAAYKQIARSSSSSALTNKQLQAVVTRMKLEQEWSKIAAAEREANKSKVRKLLEKFTKQEVAKFQQGKELQTVVIARAISSSLSGEPGAHAKKKK